MSFKSGVKEAVIDGESEGDGDYDEVMCRMR